MFLVKMMLVNSTKQAVVHFGRADHKSNKARHVRDAEATQTKILDAAEDEFAIAILFEL